MAPRACGERPSSGLAGTSANIINYHPVSPRKGRHRCATFCLGESPAQARLKCLDLCCSFEAIVKAEYGGRNHLDFAAHNYTDNIKREEVRVASITYERVLRNLVVAMYGHYVDLFRCHSATAGHHLILAYNCLEVAAKLGHYHRAVRRRRPGEELLDWISKPEIPAGDIRLNYVDAFTLLGDALHLAYGHPKALARAYDHVYHEGREVGNLPLRGKKDAEQSAVVYRAEYAQVVHRFLTLARIDCEKFVRPMPTSLVHPEMVYPNKKYELYRLKGATPGTEMQYGPVSNFRMGGLQPRIDLRPNIEVTIYPEDEVDADPRFNEYPPHEEFVEGPDWVPGQIPPKIRSPEYGGSSSDTSIDNQASRVIQVVSVTAGPDQLDEAVASTSTRSDTRKVELKPLPGLTHQFATQLEREIQKQVQEQSRKLVQEVLQRSANHIMPPTSSEAARATLSKCFQKVMTVPWTAPVPQKLAKPVPPLEQLEEREREEDVQYSLANPFAGINPPPLELLKEARSDKPGRGRTASRTDPPRTDYPPEEKKRRSSSRPRGVVEPKRGRAGSVEPSWDVSQIGCRQTDKARSQPPSEPEPPEPSPKVKSVVKSLRLNLPKPGNLESLGPAARSRYDDGAKEDRPRRDRSRHHADASVCPKASQHSKHHSGTADKGSECSDRGSSRHGRKSGQSPNQKPKKEESLGAKLLARKEREKWYKKIIDNPVLYLEECQHQILPEEHQTEIQAMRFFGLGAERATIDVLAIINWAAEYVAISRAPIPEIPAFLKTPFIMGKAVLHPIPDDPAESIHKETCVRTKAQKSWTYLCALLQFWTDGIRGNYVRGTSPAC